MNTIGKSVIMFAVFFPFLIYPHGILMHYSQPKSSYLTLFVALMWILFLYFRFLKKNNDYLIRFRKIDVLSLLLVVFIIISTLFSVDPSVAYRGYYLRYEGLAAWFCYLSLFFLSYHFVNGNKIKNYNLYISISGVVIAIYGILQHFLLDFIPRPIELVNYTRSYAFFDNPNFFGSYLVLMLFISIIIYLLAKARLSRGLSYLAVMVIFLALLYTLTRSAWLGAFVGLVLLCLFLLWKRRALFKRTVALMIGFLIVFTFVQFTETRDYLERGSSIVADASEVFSGENEGRAGSSRWFIWKTAFPLVKEYFWFGSGPDTFALVFPATAEEKEQFFRNPNIIVDKAHNEYLQMAVTLGVPALFAYLLLVGTVLVTSLKALVRLQGEQQLVLLGLTLAIIGYLVQAFFNISVITVAPYFWLFLGMAYRLAMTVEE